MIFAPETNVSHFVSEFLTSEWRVGQTCLFSSGPKSGILLTGVHLKTHRRKKDGKEAPLLQHRGEPPSEWSAGGAVHYRVPGRGQ